MRQSPGGVPPSVVHQNAGIGAVGHVHEHVVAVAQEPVLQMGHVGLVVDHQIGQQRVGPQDFRRQRHAPQLKTARTVSPLVVAWLTLPR